MARYLRDMPLLADPVAPSWHRSSAPAGRAEAASTAEADLRRHLRSLRPVTWTGLLVRPPLSMSDRFLLMRTWSDRIGRYDPAMGLNVQIVFDCHDADLMASFWALALDYEIESPPAGFDSWPAFLEARGLPVPEPGSIGAIVDPDGIRPRVLFERVPEGKVVKNRVHLDIRTDERTDASIEAKVAQLASAGATELSRHPGDVGRFVTMADPEGNEFDVT
jgi:hypothetical protein